MCWLVVGQFETDENERKNGNFEAISEKDNKNNLWSEA